MFRFFLGVMQSRSVCVHGGWGNWRGGVPSAPLYIPPPPLSPIPELSTTINECHSGGKDEQRTRKNGKERKGNWGDCSPVLPWGGERGHKSRLGKVKYRGRGGPLRFRIQDKFLFSILHLLLLGFSRIGIRLNSAAAVLVGERGGCTLIRIPGKRAPTLLLSCIRQPLFQYHDVRRGA